MRSLLLPVFLCICCCSLAAPNVRISPEPAWLYKTPVLTGRTPAANTISNGFYIELSDQQVNLVSNTVYSHVIRHIINTSGVQNASEVSVRFSPAFQQVIYHKVTIIRNGVVINQLKENAIKVVEEETDAANFEYNGLKRAFITLKDVQNGDRIEYAYSITGSNPVFANKYSDVFDFYDDNPVANYFITIIAPASRRLMFKAFNNAPAPQEQLQGGNRVYHWDNPTVQVTTLESNTPSWYNQYPYTSVTEYSNWAEVIGWALNLFHHYQFPLPAGLQAQIAGWRKTANGDKTIFAGLATHFVQDQVRYLGLEMGEHTHLPHSPADVYLHRFGDCKDKSLLLATILQQEHIPAYVALVNTSTRQKLAETAPSGEVFNHAIVAIERPPGYIFVDPTVDLQRGDLASRYIPAYGYALVVRDGLPGLQPVDPGGFYKVNIVETMDVRYDDSTRMEVNTYYSGGAADNIRSSLSNSSLQDAEESYRQYYAKAYEGIQTAAPMVITDDSVGNQFTLRESYSIPDVWRRNDKGKESFDVFARTVYDHFPDPTNVPRGAPMAIAGPHSLRYTLELKMPEDWAVDFREWHSKNESYQFDFVPTLTGNRINLEFTLNTFKDHVPPELLQQYREDYKKMLEQAEFDLTITQPGGGGHLHDEQQASHAPAVPQVHDSTHDLPSANWPAIWLCFTLGVVFTALFKWLNGMTSPVRYNAGSGEPVRGWVIVLALTVAVTLALQLLSLVDGDFFDAPAYAALGQAGGSKLQYLLLAQLGILLLWIFGCVAVLYWLLARRDIFPRMFIVFVITVLAGELALAILYGVVPYPDSGHEQAQMFMQVARTMVYGAIWITYVLRAERVKNTFVVPRRERKEDYM